VLLSSSPSISYGTRFDTRHPCLITRKREFLFFGHVLPHLARWFSIGQHCAKHNPDCLKFQESCIPTSVRDLSRRGLMTTHAQDPRFLFTSELKTLFNIHVNLSRYRFKSCATLPSPTCAPVMPKNLVEFDAGACQHRRSSLARQTPGRLDRRHPPRGHRRGRRQRLRALGAFLAEPESLRSRRRRGWEVLRKSGHQPRGGRRGRR